MKRIYVCNDTVTGILSAIYDAWKKEKNSENCSIAFRGKVEAELFCDYVEVEETEHKARAVEAMICKHLGMDVYGDLYQAMLSEDEEKGDAVLGTMLEARKIPDSRKIMEHLSHPKVEKVFELSRSVGAEAHSLKGFVRFKELSGGILYSEIAPKSQVLTCLAPHFADRLSTENWMICDKTHEEYAVHEAGKRWVLVQDEGIDPAMVRDVSERELMYEKLWRGFCHTISIKERENLKSQRGHLPLRYRPYMTEF